jgi:hypothetical protein
VALKEQEEPKEEGEDESNGHDSVKKVSMPILRGDPQEEEADGEF